MQITKFDKIKDFYGQKKARFVNNNLQIQLNKRSVDETFGNLEVLNLVPNVTFGGMNAYTYENTTNYPDYVTIDESLTALGTCILVKPNGRDSNEEIRIPYMDVNAYNLSLI
jgi:hypothetical protein